MKTFIKLVKPLQMIRIRVQLQGLSRIDSVMTCCENLHRNINILFFIHVPQLKYNSLLKATGEAAKCV